MKFVVLRLGIVDFTKHQENGYGNMNPRGKQYISEQLGQENVTRKTNGK